MEITPLTWRYGQNWLPQLQPGFAPGRVSIGVRKDELIIRAELRDTHVMTDIFPFNYPAFVKCDTFEVFLGPAGEKFYYELHVTPSNSVLQLRFDGVSSRANLTDHVVSERLFFSETSITPGGWNVFARIPLEPLISGTHSEWDLSFGRYDYVPGQSVPVISSTSPHTVCDFHRRGEWRSVSFDALPLIEPGFKFTTCDF